MFFGCRKTNPKVRFWGVRIGARPIWPSLLGKTLIFRKKLQFFWERKKIFLCSRAEKEKSPLVCSVCSRLTFQHFSSLFFPRVGEKRKVGSDLSISPLKDFFIACAPFPATEARHRHFVQDTVSQIFGKLLAFSRTRLRIPPHKRGRAGGEKSILFLHSTRSFCHICGKRRRGENYPPFFDLSIFFLGPPTPPFRHITAGKSNAPYVIMWTLYRRTTGRLIILSAATRRVPENFFAYFLLLFFCESQGRRRKRTSHSQKKKKKP